MALMTGIDPTVRVGCNSDCDNKTMIEREVKGMFDNYFPLIFYFQKQFSIFEIEKLV